MTFADRGFPKPIHVVPQRDIRPHRTKGSVCWCCPDHQAICPECREDEDDRAGPSCWLCRGKGVVPCPAGQAADIVVHHRRGDRNAP